MVTVECGSVSRTQQQENGLGIGGNPMYCCQCSAPLLLFKLESV